MEDESNCDEDMVVADMMSIDHFLEKERSVVDEVEAEMGRGS